ncbi:MAG: 1,4-dihydroxy-2-naphthoate octaprenyltransferase [Candidatus Parvibacillus calidus]|nr:MAG: 1,4-dihydroxy-2-naphthoate octaprenyltransferase [Candidatus Parvibacillus calidus]
MVTLWACLTTVFLQILSNLANDYGDTASGVDNADRIGPKRGLQSGDITKGQMKKAIYSFIALSLISGILLIMNGTRELRITYGLILFIIGIGAIAAAMKYTMGKNPYGYSGYGDIFVFLFFGLVGVLGTYFLHTHNLVSIIVLPAIAMGCLSAGVLNLNNLRDRDNDAASGKHTLVVKLGLKNAKRYHAILLITAMLAMIAFSILSGGGLKYWLYLPSFIGIIRSIVVVFRNEDPVALYPELKNLALNTLSLSLMVGVGALLTGM